MPRKADIRLGQLLVQKQWCTLRDVSGALKSQGSGPRDPRFKPLGQILVDSDVITEKVLHAALADLGCLTLGCPECKRLYLIQEFSDEASYACPSCQAALLWREPRSSETVTPLGAESAEPEVTAPKTGQAKPVQAGVPEVDPYAGKVFGGCKILEKVGAGGMGVVYKAQQLNLNRLVAVKVLSRELSRDESFVKRFVEEARSAAQLSHGNIVHINDVGEYHGIFYFTMEYVDGENVKDILESTTWIELDRALEIALQVCEALRHAHKRGIIHRDIKPENIMITRENVVKLADLGLAKQLTRTGGADRLTQTGSILGTPFYMAPEQAKDFSKVDARSDVYSLGVTLYKMITGQVPFSGRTPIEVMLRVVDGKRPALNELRKDVPPEVVQVVDRMMECSPEDRYQSVDDVMVDLRSVLERIGDNTIMNGTSVDGTIMDDTITDNAIAEH